MPNTTPNLATDYVALKSMTSLQERLAVFTAFSTEFSPNPIMPGKAVQVPLASAGGEAVENATNFEDKDKFRITFDAVEVLPVRITVGAHLTAEDRDSGRKIDEMVERKADELAEKLWAKICPLLTTDNYGAAYECAPGAFTGDDVGGLWEAVAKSKQKHLILGEGFFRRILPGALQTGNPNQFNLPGWNGVHLCTSWADAPDGIRGFAAGPTAIALASGLPMGSPDVDMLVKRRTLPLTAVGGMSIEFQTWYDDHEKADWFNWEVMFGAAKGDGSALKLLKQPA